MIKTFDVKSISNPFLPVFPQHGQGFLNSIKIAEFIKLPFKKKLFAHNYFFGNRIDFQVLKADTLVVLRSSLFLKF